MQLHMQYGNITTNIKVQMDFTLHEIRATKTVTWNYHVYESVKVRYDMILRIYLLIELRLNLKSSYHVI